MVRPAEVPATSVPDRYARTRDRSFLNFDRFRRSKHVARVPRPVRGRHGPVRVLGQRARASAGSAGPHVQPHVTPDQPDRRRAQGTPGSAPGKCFRFRNAFGFGSLS